MEITLLADHPHEANKIAQWYYNEWAHTAQNVTEEMVREKVAEKSINRNEIPLAIVIHDNNELVGVAELKYRENRNYPEYEHWLGGVFVNPPNRGNGISNLLVSEAKGKAVSLGIKQLYLQCESHNVALYKKHGFKELHQASHHDISTTIMVWVSAT
ncbi:GNAT family N-acetyltransferase [Vibrio parahaemolyticus]|uniref:GNAT family N-acetyltransferase n=1 Tax=Vibrio parahaemolyticus TaxID=670 RepID=UPI00111E59DC|nr:GNAT family N-acetyltransferase [Vibrio parahaemolyticus]MBE4291506.1 GNAT family N-acetyltransferase [Vibrio parahaemolyticus]TOD53273.1 GNAT family N-acetyltransferase [Vibrio parahaemolyticus]